MSNALKTILYRKCYETYGNKNKPTCNGRVGGTAATGYLSEECIDCPYWIYPNLYQEKTFKVKIKKCSKTKKMKVNK